MTQDNELLTAALEYAARGWPVLPLHSPQAAGKCSCGEDSCRSIGKHPRTRHGLKMATTSSAMIRNWWEKWPDANIGIVTGHDSNLVVLDVDDGDAKNGSESLVALVATNEPLSTTVVRTGSGKHLYFKHPGVTIKNSVHMVGSGLDVRSDGGYVVAAPSRHANGTRYEILGNDPPGDLPPWLVSEMSGGTPEVERPNNGNADDPVTSAPAVSEGQRNDTLFRLASALRGQHGMERDEMEPILLEYNTAKCSPPLTHDEVLRICASAYKFPAELKTKKSAKRLEENPLYWFKFNLRDWFSDQNVNVMTDYQTGWLIRLVAFAWQGGGFLPAEKEKLWKLAKAKSLRAFEKECDLVLTEFEEVEVQGHQMLKHIKIAAQYAHTLSEWMKKKDAGEASKAKGMARQAANQSGVTIQ